MSLLVVILSGGGLVVLPAMLLAPAAPSWVPSWLEAWSQDVRLWMGREVLAAQALLHALQGDPGITCAERGRPVVVERGALRLVGTLYEPPEGTTRKGGVLLLHGSVPQGRQHPLYRLLGSTLADSGFVVLVPDQRGFGASSDPPDPTQRRSFDYAGDVAAWLAYLRDHVVGQEAPLGLIGHSFGADVALTAVAEGQAPVDFLVLMGPARRLLERGGDPSRPEFAYFKRREERFMQLETSIPDTTFLRYRMRLAIDNHIGYLQRPDHVPVLLMDGERDDPNDRAFLKAYYDRLAGPVRYVTVPEADHYLNTAGLGSCVVYDRDAMREAVGVMMDFGRTVRSAQETDS